MSKRTVSRTLLLAAFVGILTTTTGCKLWLTFPPFIGGTIFGYLLAGGQNISVTVERNCFENGTPIDCSEIPGGLTAGTQ